MSLKDGLDYLRDWIRDGRCAKAWARSGNQRWLRIDDPYNREVAIKWDPPSALAMKLDSLDAFVAVVKGWNHVDNGRDSLVYVNLNGAHWMADMVRGDDVKVSLEMSRTARLLGDSAIGQRRAMTQAEAINLLRFDIEAAPELLAAVRSLRFVKTEDGASATTHGKESLGRSITREAVGLTLPEVCEIPFHLWNNVPFEVSAKCGWIVDLEDETLSLVPLAGEWEKAKEQSIGFVLSWLWQALGQSKAVEGTIGTT